MNRASKEDMKKVQIVDDSSFARTTISDAVKQKLGESVELLFAANGQEALEQYESEKPDVILLDIMMPKLDGIVVLLDIIEKEPQAKIIIVSSLGEDYHVRTAKKLGAVAYIRKPVNNEELGRLVEKYLYPDQEDY